MGEGRAGGRTGEREGGRKEGSKEESKEESKEGKMLTLMFKSCMDIHPLPNSPRKVGGPHYPAVLCPVFLLHMIHR